MNFTVKVRWRLENRVIIPRWTKIRVGIWYDNNWTWDFWSRYYRCKSELWGYQNFTFDRHNWLYPIYTNGSNATLGVVVAISCFPFPIIPEGDSENITVVPRSYPK